MRKYLYTTLLLALLAQEGVMAQENEGKKGGFFGKIKDTFSTEIKIGNYTFKDGSVYTGEMKGRKPNGKGKTVFKNGDVFEGEYVKGKREGYGIYMFPDGEKCNALMIRYNDLRGIQSIMAKRLGDRVVLR